MTQQKHILTGPPFIGVLALFLCFISSHIVHAQGYYSKKEIYKRPYTTLYKVKIDKNSAEKCALVLRIPNTKRGEITIYDDSRFVYWAERDNLIRHWRNRIKVESKTSATADLFYDPHHSLFSENNIYLSYSDRHFPVSTKSKIGLFIKDISDRQKMLRKIISGEHTSIRYVSRISKGVERPYDIDLQFPFARFAYNIAVKKCGWENINIEKRLSPSITETIEPVIVNKDLTILGSAVIQGNDGLNITYTKSKDKIYNGCQISFIDEKTNISYPLLSFNPDKKSWEYFALTFDPHYTRTAKDKKTLTVYNKNNKAIKSIAIPYKNAEMKEAISLIKSIISTKDLGYVQFAIKGKTHRFYTYGIEKLWQWGVHNCRYPTL